jgi:hypothetical protein
MIGSSPAPFSSSRFKARTPNAKHNEGGALIYYLLCLALGLPGLFVEQLFLRSIQGGQLDR